MKTDIVRFVSMGLPRTGTTVVGCSLLDHLEVLYYGELFNLFADRREKEVKGEIFGPNPDYQHKPHYPDFEITPCSMDESGYQYLERFYARQVPYKAVGFKILYTQAREGPNQDVWKYISEHPELKIINFQRENLLDVMVSLARAERTTLWHSNRKVKSRKFKLETKIAENVFTLFDDLITKVQDCIKSHQVLNLQYNVKDFQETMSDVFSFLEVSTDIKTDPKLEKIAFYRPDEELINYQELKQHFNNTKYSKYFVY